MASGFPGFLLVRLALFAQWCGSSSELTASSRFWRYTPSNAQPMRLQAEPNFSAEQTDVYLDPQDIFIVDEVVVADDSVHFLHLADGSGWAYDRVPGQGYICEFMARRNADVEGRASDAVREAASQLGSAAPPDDFCAAHAACAAHAGLCCPSPSGIVLQCCNSAAPHWKVGEAYVVTRSHVPVRGRKARSTATVDAYTRGALIRVAEMAVEDGLLSLRTTDGWVDASCDVTAEHIAERVRPAEPGELYIAADPGGLPVRSQVSQHAPVVASLAYGQQFYVLERASAESGIMLRLQGGWVSEAALDGNSTAHPVMPRTVERYIVNHTDGAAVREGPETSSERVGKLAFGDIVTALERVVNSAGALRLRTERGWISHVSAQGQHLLAKIDPLGCLKSQAAPVLNDTQCEEVLELSSAQRLWQGEQYLQHEAFNGLTAIVVQLP